MRHKEQFFDLVEYLNRVSDVLDDKTLRFPEPNRSALSQLIKNGLLPRLTSPKAPLNVVFAGPTGSGKSTLVNSVAGRWVTEPGVLRPTTTNPLIYSHDDYGPQLVSDFGYDLVTGSAPILESLTLIDTPDLDSTNLENRKRAMDAISRADVVVFVSSALRYADLVPWEVFRDVSARGVPIIFALNRISMQTTGVVTDFRRRARSEGMSMRVVRVEEHQMSGGILPAASVRELRRAIVACVPSGSEATDRTGRGTEYVVDELVAMRRSMEAGEEMFVRVSAEFDRPLSFLDRFDSQLHRDRWLSSINAVPRWARRSRWMREYEAVQDDLVTEIALAMEPDLHMIARRGSQIEIDLTEVPSATGAPTPSLSILKQWTTVVEPRGELSTLSRRQSHRKIRNAIAAITELSSGPSEHPVAPVTAPRANSDVRKTNKHDVAKAVDDLRNRINRIFMEALASLQPLSLARELAEIDVLLNSAAVGNHEQIVANA